MIWAGCWLELLPVFSVWAAISNLLLPLIYLVCQQKMTANSLITSHFDRSLFCGPLPLESAPSIFAQDCACEPDWTDSFCFQAEYYQRLPLDLAPSVCVCRQSGNGQSDNDCLQFLTRCFPIVLTRPRSQFSPISHARSSPNSCACCFNQPDKFCNQLECEDMHPLFDDSTNASCVCWRAHQYPMDICQLSLLKSRNKDKVSDRQGIRRVPIDEFHHVIPTVTPVPLAPSLKSYTEIPKEDAKETPEPSSPVFQLLQHGLIASLFVVLCLALVGAVFVAVGVFVCTHRNDRKRRWRGGTTTSSDRHGNSDIPLDTTIG